MSENIFINFSNHSSDRWSNEQKKAALNYGEIIDIITHSNSVSE